MPVFDAPFSSSGSYLASANIEVPLPFIPMFALFGDAGFNETTVINDEYDNIQYDAGIMLRAPNDVFEVYFPLLMSKNIEDTFQDDAEYKDKISFMLNLNVLNFFELMRKLEF